MLPAPAGFHNYYKSIHSLNCKQQQDHQSVWSSPSFEVAFIYKRTGGYSIILVLWQIRFLRSPWPCDTSCLHSTKVTRVDVTTLQQTYHQALLLWMHESNNSHQAWLLLIPREAHHPRTLSADGYAGYCCMSVRLMSHENISQLASSTVPPKAAIDI